MMKQHPAPPRLAQRFLTWFIRDELAEEVLGDLEEQFYDVSRDQSPAKARLMFWYQVMNYLRPFAIRGIRLSSSMTIAMYQHYFKIGWRSLSKEKLYSGIKIGGFAIGIAACLLIALFVQDELSYDTHYTHTDRIYRLLVEDQYRGEIAYSPSMPAPIGPVLSTEFPEIEVSGRLIPYDWYDAGNNQFRPIEAQENLYEAGFAYADPAILEVLEIPMIYGQRESALSRPNTIVISKSKADKYFPNQDPVGQLVILNEQTDQPYTIGGVMKDFPSNSHIQFDFFLTLYEKEFWKGEQASWCCWNYDSYFRLAPRTSISSLEENLLLIRDNYLIPYAKEQGDVGADDQQENMRFVGQPVSDIHLKAKHVYDIYPHGEERIVWLFAMVAGFILLLAMINFVNLSTAKSANRAKEVGLRKVVGSQRGQLVRQFLTESVVVSVVAMIMGSLLAALLLPLFNEIAGKDLSIPWHAWWLGPLLFAGALLTGLLAGVYPALYLSTFRPVSVLQGNLSLGSKNATLRSILVVLQFTTSIVLIICTLVSNQQMDFLLNKQIGFDKEQVFLIQGANTLGDQQEAFLSRLEQLAEVQHATITDYLPVDGTKRDFNPFWKDGRSKIDKAVSAQIWRVDENYLSTLGIQLVEGRHLSSDIASDTAALVINQTMARELGLEQPIGAKIMNWNTYTVVGVVEDFHFEDLQQEIVGLCFALGDHGSIIATKLQTDDMRKSVQAINTIWDDFMPNQPIRYSFLDQEFANMYEQVNRTSKVFTVFSGLAVLIACLGLFALSAYLVEQRRKEISIRKVVGASFQSLLGLLTVNYVWLILVSLAISIPLGWYSMNRWLEGFAHHTELNWVPFAIAGLTTMLIALLTISFESIRVIRMDPAEALRND